MTNPHPITPQPELVEQWMNQSRDTSFNPFHFYCHIANCAAHWGADQELAACLEWMFREPVTHEIVGRDGRYLDFELRAARRPNPPSLKEQALIALHAVATGANDTREHHQDLDTIRRALEQLNEE